jgi:hypothetical protein
MDPYHVGISAKDHNTKEMELYINDPLDQPDCQQMLLTPLQKIENLTKIEIRKFWKILYMNSC